MYVRPPSNHSSSCDASAAVTEQTLTSNTLSTVVPQEAHDVPPSAFLQDSTKRRRSHRNLRSGWREGERTVH